MYICIYHIYVYMCIYIYIFIRIPQTKTARQGRGSYFVSIVIPLHSRIAGRQPMSMMYECHSLGVKRKTAQVHKKCQNNVPVPILRNAKKIATK